MREEGREEEGRRAGRRRGGGQGGGGEEEEGREEEGAGVEISLAISCSKNVFLEGRIGGICGERCSHCAFVKGAHGPAAVVSSNSLQCSIR
jgi:hypothetical protein